MKLFESDKTFAFLDINPLSSGHAVSQLYMPSPGHNAIRVATILTDTHFSSSSPSTTAPNCTTSPMTPSPSS